MSELERVQIARRMYATHPDRAALVEQLGLSRQAVADLDADADRDRVRDGQDPDASAGCCPHRWGRHTRVDGGCSAYGCPCTVMPGVS